MLSVVICSHNPRAQYLLRTLDGLKRQTLAKSEWELLLIDNRSEPPLSNSINLTWHPQARIIREDELGLTPARLRGIRESVGELLVFVDDDNILASDYLELARNIHLTTPYLGAWGGLIRPEFEESPATDLNEFLPCLALREFTHDRWSNFSTESEPCGAGLCVKREVVDRYGSMVATCEMRRALDRVGANLSSAGDTDIIQTSYEIGLGTGQFTRLKMIHLIPKNRVQRNYLFRLVESIAYSNTTLQLIKGRRAPLLDTAQTLGRRRSLGATVIRAAKWLLKGSRAKTFSDWWGEGVARAVVDFRRIKVDSHSART